MAQLSIQTLANTGLDPALVAAAAGGDKFANSSREFLYVKNDSAGPVTVTFVTQTVVEGIALPDRNVSVGAGKVFLIGPFNSSVYNDVEGNVNVSYSAVTSVTVGAMKL